MFKTSTAGRNQIKAYEALRLTGYLPTPKDVPTIGWGHTGPEVSLGMVIDEPKAEAFLDQDLAPVEAAINSIVTAPLLQAQFDALVSLIFNVGIPGFKKSHLLICINAGNAAGIEANWLDWNRQGGVVLAGLKARRIKEFTQFRGATLPPAAPK
ncbi:MAG: lysozyme [Terriglobia bacterium]